jgi:hypothetical protein
VGPRSAPKAPSGEPDREFAAQCDIARLSVEPQQIFGDLRRHTPEETPFATVMELPNVEVLAGLWWGISQFIGFSATPICHRLVIDAEQFCDGPVIVTVEPQVPPR